MDATALTLPEGEALAWLSILDVLSIYDFALEYCHKPSGYEVRPAP
jgi:hypothetical protein